MDPTTPLKWASIGYKVDRSRVQLFSDFIASKGFPNELSLIEVSPEDLHGELPEYLKKYDQIRVDSPHGTAISSHFNKLEVLMRQLRATDCLFKDEHQSWWCRSLSYQAFSQILQNVGGKLDRSDSVLVVGSGSAARTAIAACAKAGFSQFNITSMFDEMGLKMIEDLKRGFLGIQFKYVPQDQLVLLPGSNCLVINTTPYAPDNELLKELQYFNFLRRQGVIMDLTFSPRITPLIKEAIDIQYDVVFGYELTSRMDHIWCEWVFKKPFDLKDFYAFYEGYLD